MTAASADILQSQRGDGTFPSRKNLLLAASTLIYAGVLVAVNSSGYAINAVGSDPNSYVMGVSREQVDNSSGAAGDKKVEIESGVFTFANSSSTDAVTIADIGRRCFVVDNATVARTPGTGVSGKTRPVAGLVHDVLSDGRVQVQIGVFIQENGTVDILVPASADYSSSGQYLLGTINSSGKFVVASAAGQDCAGVLQNAPAANAIAIVRVRGRTQVIASTTVATGALIATTSAGKSKTAVAGTVNTSDAGASSDPTVGSFVMGRALTDGATDTNHIVDLHPMGLIPTTAA